MTEIVHRGTIAPDWVSCRGCGEEYRWEAEDSATHCTCGDGLPWEDQVGTIDAIVDTEGGDRLRVHAQRDPEGGWAPSMVVNLSAERRSRRRHPWPAC